MFASFLGTMQNIIEGSGFAALLTDWQSLVMITIACVLLYLAIVRGYEPLLLLPIAFGVLLANLPLAGLSSDPAYVSMWLKNFIDNPGGNPGELGLISIFYMGVKMGIFPPLIFLGIGAMTDFGPLIASPKSFLLGAAAQAGIFITYIGALMLGYTSKDAGAISIIGGADGPTAIWLASKLSPDLLGSIAIAAYSYMALVPIIQPPIMRLLTTKKERAVVMEQLRPVSKVEKCLFPIAVTLIVSLLLPSAAPLIGMLMLGNLMRESGVVGRLTDTAQNELMNIITILLGVSVGATAKADRFLTPQTIGIIFLGLFAFAMGTVGGVLFGKIMYWATKGKVNPLIGSAGVSAVPMAARVSQKVGQEENPSNYLLMHAMGPNVAGVIGSAVAAGVLLYMLG